MTGRELVARIQEKVAAEGIAWRAETRDTFKAGDPATVVRGIATTGMATFDVLKRAAAADANFVVTHEPTFYNDKDLTDGLETDPTYLAKQRFIAAVELVIWRFHDHAHALRPDPLIAGSVRALGWTQYATAGDPRLYVMPSTTLRALAADVARRLNDHALRVVGDPDMRVSRVALGPGYGIPPLTADIDVAIGGEAAEAGGNAEYAMDAAAAGRPRGLIILGHLMSEDHGMQEVADWLHTFLSDVPIRFIPAGEPFSNVP
jgi:putative NIF3 family GTP cyclohydrolase 1 type 2